MRPVAAFLWPSKKDIQPTIVGREVEFMPNANPSQHGFLETLRRDVLEVMQSLFVLDENKHVLLSEVKLGVLRSSATQRHGATRW